MSSWWLSIMSQPLQGITFSTFSANWIKYHKATNASQSSQPDSSARSETPFFQWSFSQACTYKKRALRQQVYTMQKYLSIVCALQLNGTAQIFLQSFSVCSRNDGCTVITVLNVAKNSSSTLPSFMSEYICYNNYTFTASSHQNHMHLIQR